jgi:hypothetical protein
LAGQAGWLFFFLFSFFKCMTSPSYNWGGYQYELGIIRAGTTNFGSYTAHPATTCASDTFIEVKKYYTH